LCPRPHLERNVHASARYSHRKLSIETGPAVREFGKTKATSRTTIILYSPKLYTLQYLIDIFGITNSTPIRIQPDPSQTVDIEIRLGSDWVSKLPAGY